MTSSDKPSGQPFGRMLRVRRSLLPMIEQILMREAERDASDSNPSWAYADMKQERVKIQLTVYRGEEDA